MRLMAVVGCLAAVLGTAGAAVTHSRVLQRIGLGAAAELPCNQFKASHIVVDSEALIDTLQDQLDEGVGFADLAKTVSLCTSRNRGGYLGWFSAGMMTPSFESACAGADVGAIVKVNTHFGWHLIHLEDKRYHPTEISPAELKAVLDLEARDELQFLDVRNPPELDLASIPGVPWINLPFNEYGHWGDRVVAGELLDKARETVVICHHGMRSSRTAQFLLQNGFDAVVSLRGGIDAYAQEVDPSVGSYMNEMKGDECGSCG